MEQKESTFDDYRQFINCHGWNSNTWRGTTLKEFTNKFTIEQTKEYSKKLNNIISKRYRIKKKIENWKKIYFITLTISNKYQKNSHRTFEDKLKEIFKNNYIINEDYGKKTKRFHYHALSEEKPNLELWKYGYTLLKECNIKEEDKKRLSKYMTKLTNHTMKGNYKIIYGRKTRQKKENRKNN